MTNDFAPITQQEMIDLFGKMMPIEAVNLLWEADDTETVGEIRAKLRNMAHDLQQRGARMSRQTDRTRELCQTYLGTLKNAGISSIVVNAFLSLIRSHCSLGATASALHADTMALREQLAASETIRKALLAEIKALHETNSGAPL